MAYVLVWLDFCARWFCVGGMKVISLHPELKPITLQLTSSRPEVFLSSQRTSLGRVLRDTRPENHRGGAKQYAYHTSFLRYISMCYNHHVPVTLTPDALWYTVVAEIAQHVLRNVEPYRALFTDSDEKKSVDLLVGADGDMDVAALAAIVRTLVRFDTSTVDLRLSTDSDESLLARDAAFLEMCSPYYDYFTYACGFPLVVLTGTPEDYELMAAKARQLAGIFTAAADYLHGVADIFATLWTADAEFWDKMFHVKTCGSGSQQDIYGWFVGSLFMPDKRRARRLELFPEHLSTFTWEHRGSGNRYRLVAGMLFSEIPPDKGQVVPKFAHIIFQEPRK